MSPANAKEELEQRQVGRRIACLDLVLRGANAYSLHNMQTLRNQKIARNKCQRAGLRQRFSYFGGWTSVRCD
jgi:hypothetical protein